MDYKLPSTVKGEDYSLAHKEFLFLAKEKEVFLKFVLTSAVEPGELEEALGMVRYIGDFPIVLQPVSPGGNITPPSEVTLLKMQEMAKELFSSVKVLPQLHKWMGAK